MAKERILVIDDKIEIITFLADLLGPLDYELSIATSGQEGLAKALEERPDLILTDLNMPGMSGMDVLEALHRHDCQVPVILMTLYGSEDVAVRAFRLGVRNYISKPFDIHELLVSIEWALEEGRLRRERERLVAELSKTNRKLTQRMRELAMLEAIGRSVASLMTKKQLLKRILDAAIYLTGADVGTVFLWDKVNDQLCLQAVRRGDVYHFGLQTRIRDSHAEEVLRAGRPAWISSPTKRTGVTSYLGQRSRSLFYVPLKLGDEAIGVMGVARLGESQSPSTHIQNRLTALADYASVALKNAQLFEDSYRQTRQLATINRIAQMIAASLDLKEIMQLVVHGVQENLHAEAATLALYEKESGELVFEIILGGDEKKRDTIRLKVGQGIVGWVVQNGRSLRVNDVSQDPRFHSDIDRAIGFRTHSILCVPLTVSDQVIGAIEAINKLDNQAAGGQGQFSDEDEEWLRGAAAFVSIAVENARLHAAVRATIATQTLHETMVTLSHYINNPLQALLGAADIVRAELHDNRTAVRAVDLIKHKVNEISIVLSVLHDIALPESTVYLGSIQMLDIEKELLTRLELADSTLRKTPQDSCQTGL